ncbi:sulfatase-like hydrolase/transferase [Legionella lytica]|uniref:Sulfatase-like hydrolase/transferase n=1 Tax=Legionella lytica TaxID=96232 RepID=A0ABW8D6Y8_9GAMM
MLSTLQKNWRYLFLVPFFFMALLTAFLAENSIDQFSSEALTTSLILIALGLIPGVVMVFSNQYVRILLTTVLLMFFIISQIKTFPLLPFGLKYRYLAASAAFIIAGLLYLCRNYLDKLLFVFFGTLWLGSLFIPKHPLLTVEQFQQEKGAKNANLPPYIEIVLDEHIGLEGISEENNRLADSLRDKYLNLGFKVYGKTYSRDFRSIASFASFLNFKPIDDLQPLILHDYKKDKHSLTKNALFEELSKQGYSIHVLQSSYLDLCTKKENFNLAECITYKHTAPIPGNPSLSNQERAIGLLEQIFKKLHLDFTRIEHSTIWTKLNLPQLETQIILAPSTAAFQAFDKVLELAKKVEKNNAYFIHLLLPHDPYVFNKDCQYRGQAENKISAYFEQVSCSHFLVDKFLDVLAKNPSAADSTIIIHGDHGSRIEEPDIRLNYVFTPENIIKNYSAFFIIRSPTDTPVYDLSQISLDQLLKDIVFKTPSNSANDQQRTIYIRSGKDFDLGKYSMPNFLKGKVVADS